MDKVAPTEATNKTTPRSGATLARKRCLAEDGATDELEKQRKKWEQSPDDTRQEIYQQNMQVTHSSSSGRRILEDLLGGIKHSFSAQEDAARPGSLEDFGCELINGKVIEREDTLGELTRFMCQLVDASAKKKCRKDNFPIGCAVSGSGGGKTTMCALVAGAWNARIKDALNTHIDNTRVSPAEGQTIDTLSVVFATFSGYDDLEACCVPHQASLAFRLVASRMGWSQRQIRHFLANDKKNVQPSSMFKQHFCLHACLDLMKPKRQSEAVIILIDGLLNLSNDEDAIASILLILSNFQQSCLTQRQQQRVFIVVTSLTPDLPAMLTRRYQRPVAPVSLPPITPREVLTQAWEFVRLLKQHRSDVTGHAHNIVSMFCATGGLMKSMAKAVRFYC